MGVTIRQATPADDADVVAFTRDIWADRGGDYLPRVFADWVDTDDERQRTFVATVDDRVVGTVQVVLLSDREAWMQGMRVAPDVRDRGISGRLNEATATWARERGATVGRCMVFSWNGPALAAARTAGFAPATEFRWVHPRPEPTATTPLEVVSDPAAAWAFWQECDACAHLGGLALATDESWALCELTIDTLRRAAAETYLAVVRDPAPRGLTVRVRDYDREGDDGDLVHWAEYGVAAWADEAASRTLLAAIARDASAIGADRTRVLIPETVETVSDAALAGATIADEPAFVLEAVLAGRR